MWSLIVLPLVSAEIFYNFTSCLSNERSVVYWSNSSQAVPGPITSIPCDRICPEGYFLAPNSTTHTVQCSRCPRDTYNLGGGVRFDHRNWGLNSTFARNDCYLDAVKHLCLGWSPHEKHLVSGSAFKSGYLVSELSYYFSIVKTGKVEVKYKKQTNMLNGRPNGAFVIYLNDKEIYKNIGFYDSWDIQTFNLAVGVYKLTFSYSHYTIENSQAQTARIQYVEVRGTQFAESGCMECVGGYSEPGSGNCFLCPSDTYFDPKNRACNNCPDTHYSPPGSSSLESCKRRPKCTENDYSVNYGACINDKRVRYYLYNEPQICDSSETQLPQAEFDLPCGLCNPGYYHNFTQYEESVCSPCPDGKALTETSVSTSCNLCPAGTYASKQLQYSIWSPLPEEFLNICKTINGEDCSIHKGWVASSYTISTVTFTQGTFQENFIELTLSRFINFISKISWISFTYSLQNMEDTSSYLSFSIDGEVIKQFHNSTDLVTTERIPVFHGMRYVSWKYTHMGFKNNIDSAYIGNVTIVGSYEGGAPACVQCEEGTVSKAGASNCMNCEAGSSSDSGNVLCEKCKGNTVNSKSGGKCVECPDHTGPNRERTACVGSDELYFDEASFYIRNISKISEGHGMCSSESMQKFCFKNFIGPIVHQNSSFYLSVLNPGDFYYPEVSSEGSESLGYIYSVSRVSDLADKCNHLIKLINLGTAVSHIEPTTTGFRVAYTGGDVCNNSTYSSEINFRCDKTQYYGWPMLKSISGCHHIFEWNTKFGCHICTLNELEKVESNCYGDYKTAMMKESKDCILMQDSLQWKIPCSVVDEVMSSTEFVVGFFAIVGLIVVVSVIAVLYWRTKRKYRRLLDYMSPRD